MIEGTPENYIRRNAPTVAENCIKDLLWHGKSFQATLAVYEDNIRQYRYCNALQFSKAVMDILREVSESDDALDKFVSSRRKLLIQPSYRSNASYIRGEWETPLKLHQIVSLIRENI